MAIPLGEYCVDALVGHEGAPLRNSDEGFLPEARGCTLVP